MRIVFVLPECHQEISGGNAYNERLLAALLADSEEVSSMSVGEWRSAEPRAAIYLIDSLDLAEFRAMHERRVPGQSFVLLVHHLQSLEPGARVEAAQLQAEAQALRAFDAFVATSPFTRDYLRSQGHSQPIATIEPICSLPRRDKRAFASPVQALMACNLIPRKGVLEFLQVLAMHTQDSDDYQLDIVGRSDLDADYAEACARCVAQSELEQRVRLRGASAYASMSSWYQQANLFVSASRMETFGISLQEARHHGLPILAVEGGNSANHVAPGVTGQLFPDPGAAALGFLALSRSGTLAEFFERAQGQDPPESKSWAEAAAQLTQGLAQWFPE